MRVRGLFTNRHFVTIVVGARWALCGYGCRAERRVQSAECRVEDAVGIETQQPLLLEVGAQVTEGGAGVGVGE